METEEIVNERPHNMGLKIASLILLVLLIYFLVMSILSPGRKMKELYSEFGPGTNGKNNITENMMYDSAYVSMLHEKAFLSSRVEMAETDSVYLTISIPDSTVNLEISGVTVHTAHLSDIKVSRMLEKGNRYIIFSLLSSPLSIKNEISTIKKEPLTISIAPKDTSEFQPDVVPDTAGIEQVNYILELDHGIRIHFYQEEEDGRFSTYLFDLKDRLHSLSTAIKSVAFFRVPDYHPYIKVKLPRADARIFYRALPEKGQIGIYL
jgi:hypothetical protein